MADTAVQTQYRQEFIAGFEVRESFLRASVTTEAVIKGNTATFLVADSGGASAVTRGVNGLIPARADNLTQSSATLAEWHDLRRTTDFNIFSSQGNQRQIMQMTTMAVINRKVDADIIAILDTGTVDTGVASTASLALIAKAKAILGIAAVPTTEMDNMFAAVTPGFMAYLMQIPEFTSADYVDVKPLSGPTRTMLRWFGVNFIEHPNLTGVGTTTELCYMYHRSAIGHAVDVANIQSLIGHHDEQGYSWARCSVNMGSVLLQNSGIVQMKHDGSAYVGT